VPQVGRGEVAVGEHFGGASEIQPTLSQRDGDSFSRALPCASIVTRCNRAGGI